MVCEMLGLLLFGCMVLIGFMVMNFKVVEDVVVNFVVVVLVIDGVEIWGLAEFLFVIVCGWYC